MSKSLGYSIVIREDDFEDGDFFEARVLELPNVIIYEKTYQEAYEVAVDSIQVTAESFAEDGAHMPTPMINYSFALRQAEIVDEYLNLTESTKEEMIHKNTDPLKEIN